jgi:hypothetical protein
MTIHDLEPIAWRRIDWLTSSASDARPPLVDASSAVATAPSSLVILICGGYRVSARVVGVAPLSSHQGGHHPSSRPQSQTDSTVISDGMLFSFVGGAEKRPTERPDWRACCTLRRTRSRGSSHPGQSSSPEIGVVTPPSAGRRQPRTPQPPSARARSGTDSAVSLDLQDLVPRVPDLTEAVPKPRRREPAPPRPPASRRSM